MMLIVPLLCFRFLWDRLAVWGQMEELFGTAEFHFYRSLFIHPAWWVVRVPGRVLKSCIWKSRAHNDSASGSERSRVCVRGSWEADQHKHKHSMLCFLLGTLPVPESRDQTLCTRNLGLPFIKKKRQENYQEWLVGSRWMAWPFSEVIQMGSVTDSKQERSQVSRRLTLKVSFDNWSRHREGSSLVTTLRSGNFISPNA